MTIKANSSGVKARRLALFAHWDPDGMIDPYVIHYLTELKKVADIVFYSDCDLAEGELDKVREICRDSGASKHGSYDFGSWQMAHGMAQNYLADYDELILANDSCYGPFHSFSKLFEEMSSEDVDYWGLTEHADKDFGNTKHLQSYFLVIKRRVFHSSVFTNFLRAVKPQESKHDVILKYEIGLSRLLEQSGFRRGVRILSNGKNSAYTNHGFKLLRKGVWPFIKREVLVANPGHCSNLTEKIRAVYLRGNHEIITLILAHLNRFTKGGYADNWKLTMPFKFTIIHSGLIRLKTTRSNERYYGKVIVFGVRLIKFPLPVKYRDHQKTIDYITKETAGN